MLSLIEDRLTQLEAQRGVAYRGDVGIYNILKRMDNLVYNGPRHREKCATELKNFMIETYFPVNP